MPPYSKNLKLIFVSLVFVIASDGIAADKLSSAQPPLATVAEAEGAFRDINYLPKAFIETAPTSGTEKLKVAKLGEDAGQKDLILEFAEEIADGVHGKIDSLLLAHNGRLLFESYYRRGRIDLPHPQASATKAHTAMVLGRAIGMGYLKLEDLDKPMLDFLKEVDLSKAVNGAETITLAHALTMRGGLRVTDEKWEELKTKPEELQGQVLVQALLKHSAPVTEASQEFAYGNFNPNLVMQVIEAIVPGSAQTFIQEELLNKMGISNYRWSDTVSGLPDGGAVSSMTSRDMIKWGILARNKGKWGEEQLIPEAYVQKAISRVVDTSSEELHYGGKNVTNQGYGYFWWNADMSYEGKTFFTSSAQGGWGQMIILIEDLDLIVVFTGHDNDTPYLQLTAERILPAFINKPR